MAKVVALPLQALQAIVRAIMEPSQAEEIIREQRIKTQYEAGMML